MLELWVVEEKNSSLSAQVAMSHSAVQVFLPKYGAIGSNHNHNLPLFPQSLSSQDDRILKDVFSH